MRVRGARTAVVLEAVDACEGDLQGRWVQPDFEMSFGKHHRAFGRQQRRACLRCGDGGSEHNIGEMSWRAMPDGAWRAVFIGPRGSSTRWDEKRTHPGTPLALVPLVAGVVESRIWDGMAFGRIGGGEGG